MFLLSWLSVILTILVITIEGKSFDNSAWREYSNQVTNSISRIGYDYPRLGLDRNEQKQKNEKGKAFLEYLLRLGFGQAASNYARMCFALIQVLGLTLAFAYLRQYPPPNYYSLSMLIHNDILTGRILPDSKQEEKEKVENARQLKFLNINLKPASDGQVWKVAFERNLAEQSFYNAAAGDVIKAAARVWGWVTLDLLLYQGENLFNNRKRKRRSPVENEEEEEKEKARKLKVLNIDLEPASDGQVWKTAFERNLAEQNFYNNAAGDVIKAGARVWGWVTLDILLYQAENLFNNRKRKRRSLSADKEATSYPVGRFLSKLIKRMLDIAYSS